MTVTEAPGWTADWLNGWLAAIGVTMLAPRDEDSEGWLRVSWTAGPDPYALIHHREGTSAARLIAGRLPTQDDLDALLIATGPVKSGKSRKAQQKFTVEQYGELAGVEREQHEGHFAAYCTDLDAREQTPVKGALNAVAPGTCAPFKGAFDCRSALDRIVADIPIEDFVRRSLVGTAPRIAANGLSFDVRRMPPGIGSAEMMVDPVVELLAFCAMPLFPVRSSGWRVRTRAWALPPAQRKAFTWFSWGVPLDRWAVDALLDRHHRAMRRAGSEMLPDVGTVKFTLAPHRPIDASDQTRGYGSVPR